MQQSSGLDVIDVRQGVGRVEVDDEEPGVGHVEARAAAGLQRRDVEAARPLPGRQVPEDDGPVLRHRDQLVRRRTERDVTDDLRRYSNVACVCIYTPSTFFVMYEADDAAALMLTTRIRLELFRFSLFRRLIVRIVAHHFWPHERDMTE